MAGIVEVASRKSWRWLLATGVALAPLSSALAQQAPATSPQGPDAPPQSAATLPQSPAPTDASAEPGATDIVVTGSRLRTGSVVSPAPVTTLGAADLQRKGTISISEALNELPQLGIGTGAQTSSPNALSRGYGAGTSLINLRNLGAQRTLVLVDGRRFVGGSPGTSSVDLNSIPSIMIDRVDVVTGAASAVYGADAVSGVVNIVLRNQFNGIEATGRAGISRRGDAAEQQLAVLVGKPFDGGRGHALLSFEYSKQGSYLGRDRPDFGLYDANNFTVAPLNGSTAGPFDRIYGSRGQFSFDPSGALVPFTTQRYQRNPTLFFQLPSTRYIASGSADYKLVDKGDFTVDVFAQGTYADTHVDIAQNELFLQFDGNSAGTTINTGNGSNIQFPLIPSNNPYLLALVPTIGPLAPGGTRVDTRFTSPRSTSFHRTLARFVGGVRGDLPGSFAYEAYYQYGRAHSVQTDRGTLDRSRIIAALNVDNNGTPNNFADDRCVDPAFRALGCVPLNFLGNQPDDPAFIAYATVPESVVSTSVQHVGSASVNGPLFNLPAGAVNVVGGVEYRKESTRVVPTDSLNGSGTTRVLKGVDGAYDVREVFGEISIPLLKDSFLGKMLEIGGAARYSDYSTVGGKFSYSGRVNWTVVPELRLRAVYATAVRAPNINELFQPGNASIASVVDPCDTRNDNGTAITLSAQRQASCSAVLGALAPTLDQVQIQRGTVRSIAQGNTNLDAEKARTITAGIVLTPRGPFRNFTLTADYYDIRIDRVITQLVVQDVVNQCFDQPNLPTQFCSLITRNAATGQLLSVQNTFFNGQRERVRGLDVEANYRIPLGGIGVPGRITLQGNWSHLFSHSFLPFSGATTDQREGQVGDFKDRFTANVALESGGFRLAWQGRFLGPAVADTLLPITTPGVKIGAVAYHDVQASIMVDRSFEFNFGVKNLLDKDPPLVTSPARTNLDAFPTVSGIYDTRGRFFYAGFRVNFK